MTNEPVRWASSGTSAEREMLALLGSERPSEELSARMRAVVVAPALATLGAVSTSGGVGAAGAAEAASAATGATHTSGTLASSATGTTTVGGGLGGGAIALGALMVTGVIGLGWYFTSQSDTPAGRTPSAASVSAPAEHDADVADARKVPQEVAPGMAHAADQPASPERPAQAGEQSAAVPAVRGSGSSAVSGRAASSLPSSSQPGSSQPGSGAVAKTSDAGSLSRELAILEQARRALDRNDRGAAAGLLATYRAEYPDGQLKSEANVLEQRARSAR